MVWCDMDGMSVAWDECSVWCGMSVVWDECSVCCGMNVVWDECEYGVSVNMCVMTVCSVTSDILTLFLLLTQLKFPRVLYSWLVSGRQETDLPLLQREGRPKAALSPSLGETSCSLWTAARLHSLFCCLAPSNLDISTDYLLSTRSEIEISSILNCIYVLHCYMKLTTIILQYSRYMKYMYVHVHVVLTQHCDSIPYCAIIVSFYF